MADLFHYWGGDLYPSSRGDLMTADGTERTKQRLLRRLLTNPGEYSYNPEYGAGLPQWIGRTLDVPKLTALIRGQVLLEAGVAKTPEPTITIQQIANGISCSISYTDAATNTSQLLTFNIKA